MKTENELIQEKLEELILFCDVLVNRGAAGFMDCNRSLLQSLQTLLETYKLRYSADDDSDTDYDD